MWHLSYKSFKHRGIGVKRNQQGMTLLEVIVALAVFAIAAVSITKSLGDQMANMPILEERTLAQWVASNQMVDARLEGKFPDLGKKEGSVDLADKEWFWRKEVIKTTDDNFRMIRISVSDDERYGRIIAQVSSYVLKTE
ncbi:type II secretion system protein GspI [Shewanella colwelliana]|uniref:Type II secretion system protein I n=1 Tax=Shewanella colwelliana TaxID=23 RepID=A0ABQ4P4E3_SHECO|nr:type II secretion system minor pseudopilin GspI [Shewanella colwelliana]GIU19400.1 type II secretion system protein GspI [Shewanella colwelliana]GIU42398.1 type II secretion system protein GspI [Shewanella colwelliana]